MGTMDRVEKILQEIREYMSEVENQVSGLIMEIEDCPETFELSLISNELKKVVCGTKDVISLTKIEKEEE